MLTHTIGIRVAPQGVTFAIYEPSSGKVVNVEVLRIPKALGTPEALKYIRTNILDVLREYNVIYGGIRLSEPFAKSLSVERVQIEGVVQESFASSQLLQYFAGHIATLAARLRIDKPDFKRYVDGEINYTHVRGWADYSKEEREAIFAAVGAANV